MIQNQINETKQQIQSALSMLFCPEKNPAVFFCISQKCHFYVNPIVCNTQSCKSCQRHNQPKIQSYCQKQKLILIDTIFAKILNKKQKMSNKQKQSVQNTLNYFEKIIDLISDYRQKFQKMSRYYGLSLEEFYLIEGLTTSQIENLNHQHIKNIYSELKSFSYFSFIDISEKIGEKIFNDVQNSFAYYYNQNLSYSFTKVPFNTNHQYKFNTIVSLDVLDKLDREAKQLEFDFKLSNQQFQKITSQFIKVENLTLFSENLANEQNILKLSNLKALKQLSIIINEKQRELRSKKPQKKILFNIHRTQKQKFSIKYLNQIFKFSSLQAVKYKTSLDQQNFKQDFNHYFSNYPYSEKKIIYQIYPSKISYQQQKKTFWIQNLKNLCQSNLKQATNLKQLILYSETQNNQFRFVNQSFGNQFMNHNSLQILQLIEVQFKQNPKKMWQSLNNLKKLSLTNCLNLKQNVLTSIGENLSKLSQLKITSIDFTQKQVSLIFLKNMSKLQSLALSLYSQTHKNLQTIDLNYLAQLVNLKHLNLINYQNFNSKWILYLKQMKKLQSLYLNVNEKWSIYVFKQFKCLLTLKTLVLIDNTTANKNQSILYQLDGILAFKRLKNLYISPQIGNQQIATLTNTCKRLERLVLNNRYQYNNQYIYNLCRLKNLKYLRLKIDLNIQVMKEHLKNNRVQVKIGPLPQTKQLPYKKHILQITTKQKQYQKQNQQDQYLYFYNQFNQRLHMLS